MKRMKTFFKYLLLLLLFYILSNIIIYILLNQASGKSVLELVLEYLINIGNTVKNLFNFLKL